LETARLKVKANPQDGQVWLDLAYVYHSLSLSWTHVRLLFSAVYLPRCIEAYQKAGQLLPDHPVPHAALGLFTLEPYLADRNAPAAVLRSVQEELKIAQELEARDPSLAKGAPVTSQGLENALNAYFYNDATATVNAAAMAAYNATRTAEATLNYATITVWAIAKATSLAWMATDMACWATAGTGCTATASPTVTLAPTLTMTVTSALSTMPIPLATQTPSATPQPPPTPLPTTEGTAGNGQRIIIFLAAGVIVLVIMTILTLKRLRRIAKK
jgi:hypothetical protein